MSDEEFADGFERVVLDMERLYFREDSGTAAGWAPADRSEPTPGRG